MVTPMPKLRATFTTKFKKPDGTESSYDHHLDVIAVTSDSEGNPYLWCLNDKNRLFDPTSSSNLVDIEYAPLETVIPAHPGWWIEWLNSETKELVERAPIIAFLYAKYEDIRAITAPAPDGSDDSPWRAGEFCRFVYEP
jgi:hypothetical protein